jgi:hypothetical protein
MLWLVKRVMQGVPKYVNRWSGKANGGGEK